jgi:hypothetical protein
MQQHAHHGLSCDRVIAMSDEEIAQRLFDFIGQIDDADDMIRDALYFLADETFERFAPEAARAQILHHWRDASPDDLLEAVDGLRRRQATRLLRDSFDGRRSDG